MKYLSVLIAVGIGFPCVVPAEAAASAITITYEKRFVLNGVKPTAGIEAGGLVETWFDKLSATQGSVDILPATVPPTVPPPAPFVYQHCTDMTGSDTLGLGFPIGFTGRDVSDVVTPDPGLGQNVAFTRTADIPTDNKNEADSAQAQVAVFTQGGLDGTLLRTPGGGTLTLRGSVEAKIRGFATAGEPKDSVCHSAESVAAVRMAAAKQFLITADPATKTQPLQALQQVDVAAGFTRPVNAKNAKTLNNKDPLFFTVTDLDTGLNLTELVMGQTLSAFNGGFAIDDTGIRLTIDRTDPNAFATLDFSNVHPWVLNPYTYGARLDQSGLSAYGLTALAGWTLTTTIDTIEAFFPYGLDGRWFDYALISPPESLFVEGHQYAYSAGELDGAVALQTVAEVPEPGTLALLGAGLAVLKVVRRRGWASDRPDCVE